MTANATEHKGTTALGPGRLFLDALLWSNFLVGGGVAIGVGLAAESVLPDASVSASLVSGFAVLVLVLVTALLRALLKSSDQTTQIQQERDNERPRIVVKSTSKPYQPYSTASCIFIVEWSGSAVLAQGCGVIISVAEGPIERPIGFGTVRHQQTDRATVVTLDFAYDDVSDYVAKLLNPDEKVELMSKLRIGGTIPTEQLDQLRQHHGMNPKRGATEPSVGELE